LRGLGEGFDDAAFEFFGQHQRAEHAGAVVFGGPMSVNDDLDWVRREIDWLAVPLSEDKPLLGVCLGAQMLARQLGVRVFTYPDKRSEIGYCPITPTPNADRLCDAPFPRHVYHWHCDGFELPRGARLLAASDGEFPNQAFAFGSRALALQFHPEVTYAMICRWTTRGDERLDGARVVSGGQRGTRPHAHPRFVGLRRLDQLRHGRLADAAQFLISALRADALAHAPPSSLPIPPARTRWASSITAGSVGS